LSRTYEPVCLVEVLDREYKHDDGDDEAHLKLLIFMGLYYTSFINNIGAIMSKIIEHFQTLTQIPHCSKEADKLLDFLVSFAKERDYVVEVDKVKNIYIHKGTPTLCLQAHYDMVCMGKAPVIETLLRKDGIS